MRSYDKFPLFKELKRKETTLGIVCLDQVWDRDHVTFSVTVNYQPVDRVDSIEEAVALYIGL